jgi:hypothetical protein
MPKSKAYQYSLKILAYENIMYFWAADNQA